jgi:hypothetical protein
MTGRCRAVAISTASISKASVDIGDPILWRTPSISHMMDTGFVLECPSRRRSNATTTSASMSLGGVASGLLTQRSSSYCHDDPKADNWCEQPSCFINTFVHYSLLNSRRQRRVVGRRSLTVRNGLQ